MMDHAIDEMETIRAANEQKVFEIKRINGQLNKALEVIKYKITKCFSMKILFFLLRLLNKQLM